MKLTKYHRDAFVMAALQDVPTQPYEERAQKIFHNAMDQLWKDTYGAQNFGLREQLAKDGALDINTYHTPFGYLRYYGFGCDYEKFQMKCPEAREEMERLKQLHNAQEKALDQLAIKLQAVARACTTRKALAEALPEFEKYLPEETTKGTNLPAVANVVADFVKAGWPKGKHEAEQAA